MTPKEKAEELLESVMFSRSKQLDLNTGEYQPIPTNPHYKECALIAVDEMLGLGSMVGSDLSDSFYIYWTEVKQEIKNL
jgi:hypothetical protein